MDLLASRRGRRVLLAALYFSEGAPMGWLWWALPPQLRAAGAPADEVATLTALFVLPWTLKALWAPLVDGLRGPRWGLRHWALAAQVGMAASLLPLLGGVDLAAPWSLAPLLLTHAALAATQDVAVDALALHALPEHERGSANGWMQCGMLLGRGLFAGLSLRLAQVLGFGGVIVCLVLATLSTGVLLVVAAREPPSAVAELGAARGPGALRARLGAALGALRRALSAPRTWAGLAFALLAGAGFEAVGGTAGSLLVDLGVSQERIGDFYAVPVLLAMGAGALLGGRWADGRPRVEAARGALLLVTASVALLAGALLAGLRGDGVLALLGLVYLTLGSLTASSYALFMDLCDPRVGGTHLALFMGATNLCESWAVRAMGFLIGASPGVAEYARGWLALAAVSLLGLLALRRLLSSPAATRPAP